MMMTDDQMTPTEPEAENPAVEAVAPETPAVAEEATPNPEPEVEAAAEPVAEEAPVVEAVAEEAPAPAPEAETTVEAVVEQAPPPAPVAEVAPVAAAEPSMDDAMLFEAAMAELDQMDQQDGGRRKLQKGDRIEATVIQVDKDRVFVNLGTKSEGVIPLPELTDDNVDSAADLVSVGDKIQVVVIRPEGGADGNAIVSKKKADFEDQWDGIIARFESGEMFSAQVVDRVKGGLVVDIGVRGFVPATHVGSGKLRNIEKYVGNPLQVKIIELDRERKKVVLSNREAEEKARAAAKDDLFTKVNPGDKMEGTVRRLTDYGAFVDLGGVDGLLHISEMSWMRINHPKEMFKEGQKIQVMVLRLDKDTGKISLGHRQVLPDPWTLIKQNYTVGQKLTCSISRVVMSGAFIRLPENAEAFMPISEMSTHRIKHPSEVIQEGQEVEAQIIDLRPEERRMVLSLRAAGSAQSPTRTYEGGGEDDRRRGGKPGGKKGGRGGRHDDDFDDFGGSRRGMATGGATIGERLGMLKGLLRPDADEETTETVEVKEEPEAKEETEA